MTGLDRAIISILKTKPEGYRMAEIVQQLPQSNSQAIASRLSKLAAYGVINRRKEWNDRVSRWSAKG